MAQPNAETLLNSLEVRLNAYAVCEVEDGYALRFGSSESTVVSFVLKGEGTIESGGRTIEIRAGSIVIVPRNSPKQINALGPTTSVVEAADRCPITERIPKVSACRSKGDLVMVCGSVTATLGAAGLFDHLQQTLVERPSHRAAQSLFDMLLGELSEPGAGTRAFAEATMKQLFLLLLRDHLEEHGWLSPFSMPLVDASLSRAVAAVLGRPQDPHSVEGLASLAGMSRSSFARRFTESYGRSPKGFVQAVRLQNAARLLQTSELPVKCIAAAVGYASRSHLSRAFRSEFGSDPTAFRERSRNGFDEREKTADHAQNQ